MTGGSNLNYDIYSCHAERSEAAPGAKMNYKKRK